MPMTTPVSLLSGRAARSARAPGSALLSRPFCCRSSTIRRTCGRGCWSRAGRGRDRSTTGVSRRAQQAADRVARQQADERHDLLILRVRQRSRGRPSRRTSRTPRSLARRPRLSKKSCASGRDRRRAAAPALARSGNAPDIDISLITRQSCAADRTTPPARPQHRVWAAVRWTSFSAIVPPTMTCTGRTAPWKTASRTTPGHALSAGPVGWWSDAKRSSGRTETRTLLPPPRPPPCTATLSGPTAIRRETSVHRRDAFKQVHVTEKAGDEVVRWAVELDGSRSARRRRGS